MDSLSSGLAAAGAGIIRAGIERSEFWAMAEPPVPSDISKATAADVVSVRKGFMVTLLTMSKMPLVISGVVNHTSRTISLSKKKAEPNGSAL